MTNHPIEPHPVLVRVAKAMADDRDWETYNYGGYLEWRQGWIDRARAALEALREPTPDMVEAGLYHGRRNLPLADQFTAMINTIIGESGRDTDRNPEGGDAQRLRAEHESGGPEGIARTSSDRNAGEI